jgi:hypothetical protein
MDNVVHCKRSKYDMTQQPLVTMTPLEEIKHHIARAGKLSRSKEVKQHLREAYTLILRAEAKRAAGVRR